MTATQTTVAPVARRHKDAIAAQEGACNALAIANALVSAIREARADGKQESADAACMLIAHQLAFLMRAREMDKPDVYDRAMRECEGIVDRAASPHCLPAGVKP